MQRRHFVRAIAGTALTTGTVRLSAQAISHDPFQLGVASGSPALDGFVLWTRLLAAAGSESLPNAPIRVHWELASDQQFKRIVRSGAAFAVPDFAHSVHIEVTGLLPSKAPYWYRFRVADVWSPVGRTRTLPSLSSQDTLRFALASCQNYEHGYFSAYRHMIKEELDAVLFVGDYIYEYGMTPNRVRQHNGPTCITLDDYRARYALYKSDPDLQLGHAACPWIVTWDDHEVANDYARDRSESDRGAGFLARREAAYRAYWEHQPLRRAQLPSNGHMQLYRTYKWGQTADLHILDSRQYRDYQVCTPSEQGGSRTVFDKSCPERLSFSGSMLGANQEAWLNESVLQSPAAFNIVGQQSIMAQMRMATRGAPESQPAEAFWNDSWDGYPIARKRALSAWGEKKNVVTLGGDVHATYISDLQADFDDPSSPILATEIVGTSITSPSWSQAVADRVMRANPHMKFAKSDQRGYMLLEVSTKKLIAHARVIDNARVQDTVVSTAASFVVEPGRPGAQKI
jgi:alkaline phosphatase D